jgi:hypothetical protein
MASHHHRDRCPTAEPQIRTIQDQWKEFAQLIPAELPMTFVVHQRRAFYSGVLAMLETLHDIGAADAADELGVQWLEGLQAEVAAFFDGIGTPEEVAGR